MGYQGQQSVVLPQVILAAGAGSGAKSLVSFTLQLRSATFTRCLGLAPRKVLWEKKFFDDLALFLSWEALFSITPLISQNHIIGSLQSLGSHAASNLNLVQL